MSERPILFSGPMVRAILAGQKTVTRRVVTPQPPPGCDRVTSMPLSTETSWHNDATREKFPQPKKRDGDVWMRCPYGMPGDTLWVRETWAPGYPGTADPYLYRATYEGGLEHVWTPSIHMPRWASRITLRMESVRVERLHAIDEADAILEGVDAVSVADVPRNAVFSRRDDFVQLWEKINGKRAPWKSNPWVWRVAFDVVEVKR